MKKIKIGMFGFGTVGTGVYQLLEKNKNVIAERCHSEFEITKVVVKDTKKKRPFKLSKKILSNRPEDIFNKPLDVILELIGDKVLTKKIFSHCHAKQIPLITANKAFLAEEGKFLSQLSLPFLGIDASVAGSIPILKTLEFGLNGNDITTITGIINGTANFILSNMDEKKSSFIEELKAAQELGYAEADPTFDVKGQDTAHKLTILMGLAWDRNFSYDKLTIEGIDNIEASDIHYANEFGYKIKLLGIAKKITNKSSVIYEGRVHPALLPSHSMLASVSGAYNGVYLEGNFSGPYLAYGQGAGSLPTASAVVSDLMLLAEFFSNQENPPKKKYYFNHTPAKLLELSDIETEYYIHLKVTDHTGVLAEITKILAEYKISISKVIQKQIDKTHQNSVDIIIITHQALEKNINLALKKINQKKFITEKTKRIRIETGIH